MILLRLEASDASQSRSDTGAIIVQAGGAAGFVIPPLRYYIGTGEDEAGIAADAAQRTLRSLAPRPGQQIAAGHPVLFRWIGDSRAKLHRLEVRDEAEIVLSALIDSGGSNYTAPPFLREFAGTTLVWRVIAISESGRSLARSGWSEFGIQPAAP
jgi:hypothetical protein